MVRDRSSICGRASESNSPPERYLPDLVIAARGEERRRMLVLQLILAGDANFDTFPLWSFGQRLDIAASSYREKRKLLLIQRRGSSSSNRLSSLPRIYGFMKGDSTAKTCDPSTVKRVSGQQSRSGAELCCGHFPSGDREPQLCCSGYISFCCSLRGQRL